MEPRLQPGDYVPGIHPPGRVRRGDTVVFRRAGHPVLIKEVSRALDGHYEVRGTHPQSTDSRDFGPVPAADLIARVILTLRAPRRP